MQLLEGICIFEQMFWASIEKSENNKTSRREGWTAGRIPQKSWLS